MGFWLPNSLRSRFPVWLMLAAVAVSSLGMVIVFRPGGISEPPVTQHKPVESVARAAEIPFLGSQACIECHAERVAEYRTTKHFRTCRIPELDAMRDILKVRDGKFQTRNPTLSFHTYREGNQLFQAAIRQTETGEKRTVSRIDLILGAGASDEVYLAWHDDGRMYELPIAWIESAQKWGAAAWWRNSQFDKLGPPDGARDLTLRCLECHSTAFEHVAGTLNQYARQNHLMGVSCENCHGPAREHVALHRLNPTEKTPQAIVRPARLSRERQIETCTQCHSNAIKHRGPALQYRPGKPLDEFYKTVLQRTTDEDHVANQIDYLRQSQCFQQDPTLTCVTCHNPHNSAGDDSPRRIEKSCLGCHDRVDCGERSRLPVAVQDQCIDCHLPTYLKINVNFQTEDDDYVPPLRRHEHRIAVHPAARDEVVWKWQQQQPDTDSQTAAQQLAVQLARHYAAEGDRHRARHHYLGEIAARREVLRFEDTAATRGLLQQAIAVQNQIDADFTSAQNEIEAGHYDAAEALLRKLLQAKPDYAMAWGKLGTILAVKKDNAGAFECLRKVTQFDPDLVYGESMMGWLSYLDGRYADAVTYFRKADQIEPYNALVNLRLGLALIQLQRTDEARTHLEKAAAIDPKNLEACRNLLAVYRQQGNPGAALPYAQRAAMLTDWQDLDVLVELAEIQAETGDFRGAAETMSTAVNIAEAAKSQRAPVLRRRLNHYREKRGR